MTAQTSTAPATTLPTRAEGAAALASALLSPSVSSAKPAATDDPVVDAKQRHSGQPERGSMMVMLYDC